MPREGSAEWFRIELSQMGESTKGTKATLEMRYEAVMMAQTVAVKPRSSTTAPKGRSRTPNKSPPVKKTIAKSSPKENKKPTLKPTLAAKSAPPAKKAAAKKSPARAASPKPKASPRGKSPGRSPRGKSPAKAKAKAKAAANPEVNAGWLKDRQLGKKGKEGTCYLVGSPPGPSNSPQIALKYLITEGPANHPVGGRCGCDAARALWLCGSNTCHICRDDDDMTTHPTHTFVA